MPDFTILSDFEVARSIAAIEAVGRAVKPVAEVGNVKVPDSRVRQLQGDLKHCLSLASERGVQGFIRKEEGGRWSYGFYRHPWVLDALQFLHRQKLSAYHRDWIAGLLFGYTPDAIQRFLTAGSDEPGPTSPPAYGGDMEGISPPGSTRSRSRSPRSDRYLTVR